MVSIANKIEYQINSLDKKLETNNIKSKPYKKGQDIVDEFRKEFDITNDFASDEDIKKLLEENKNDKFKTYQIIINSIVNKNN